MDCRNFAAALACTAALACSGGTGPSTTEDTTGETTQGTDTTAGTQSTTTTNPVPTEVTILTETVTSAPTTTTVGPTQTGTGSTGGIEYCNLGGGDESTGAQGPWLEVWHSNQPIADGMTLTLTCGGQGAWMFQLDPFVGGYEPGDEYIYLGAELDLDGYDYNMGHFYYQENNSIRVACYEDSDYYPTGEGGVPDDIITILLPDELEIMPHVLDGVAGSLRVWLEVDGDVLERAATLTVFAPMEGEMCGY